MVALCLMASNGYPLGLACHQEQGLCRVVKDCQPYLPSQGARTETLRLGSLYLRPSQCEEPWKPISGFSESHQSVKIVKIDSAVRSPVLIDVQDTRPDSVLFSFGIAEQCTRHEKILQFLTSRSIDVERGGLDLSLLSDLMGLQALAFEVHQPPYTPSLIYSDSDFEAQKPLLDFVGDMARSSKITVLPDGQVLFTGNSAEMKDVLSIVDEFYLSKNTTRWRMQSVLVPHLSSSITEEPDPAICGLRRLECIEAQATVHSSSLEFKAVTVAPLKSPEKIKLKPSPKKKNSRKGGRERDLYKRNYFHACESLLSLMIDKKQYRKTAILSIKKSGPELPEFLNKFSAGIAGTGLAVLFTVICKVACGRVPFCASRLLNTGFGFGLVWLSWAVNRLRDAIVYIIKDAGKLSLKEDEMMRKVDRSVNDIYFRAATLMAVAVLRLA